MHPAFFWKTWRPGYQRVFQICVALCAISLLFLWVSDWREPAPVFTPQHGQELEILELPAHTFQKGATTLTVVGEHLLVFDHVLGSELKPNIEASYLFLGILLCGISVLLAVLSTLPRFWFYMGMGLFILCVVSFRLDSLGMLGANNSISVAAILLLYAFAGYYFQFIRRYESLLKRTAVFISLTIVVGLVISFFSQIDHPIYFLSANALTVGVIFTILFVFTVSHEIIASFITVLTRGHHPTRSLRHFLIVTAIYWINLLLIYADKKGLIEWDFFPFNLFLLLTISGVLGLWGFRQRESQYESIMKADPVGTYFFLALAGIGFGTIGYLTATANDPPVQIVKDAILYSHLGYGIIFFVYIIANFLNMLGANMPVYKVLYKPNTMPYFTFRLAGLIATFAFFAYSNYQVSINQVVAGHYNAVGDFHLAQDSLFQAESNYRRSVLYANRNYHAHYALAEMEASRWKFDKEQEELYKLVHGRPIELAYLNYSRILELTNKLEESADLLKLGLHDFPKSALIQNALGLNYAKRELEDSAILMMKKARNSFNSETTETNLMGLWAKFRSGLPADALLEEMDAGNLGVAANALALASSQGKTIKLNVDTDSDSVLTSFSMATMNNYLLNHLGDADTALTSKVVGLARKPVNARFKHILLAAAAENSYSSGEIMKAFKLMHEAAFLGQQSKYYNILGLWSLEQGAPQVAVLSFDQALLKNHTASLFYRALALTEAGDFTPALSAWDSLLQSRDSTVRLEANRMKVLLTLSPVEAIAIDDDQKMEFARLRYPLRQQKEFEKYISTISNPGNKARAIVERCEKFEEADEPEMVLNTLALAKSLQFSDKLVFQAGVHLKLRSIARLRQWQLLEKEMKAGATFDGIYQQEKVYFDALLHEQAGKSALVSDAYQWLGSVNPFFEDAVVDASRFAAENGKDPLVPYNILINALDRNPNSIKLLKAYFVQAAQLDFDDSAKASLDKLHKLLSPEAFVQFAREHPEIFDINQN